MQLGIGGAGTALLHAGLSSGLLQACETAQSATQLALRMETDVDHIVLFCRALAAYGALEVRGDRFVLTESWSGITSWGIDELVERRLLGALAEQRVLADALPSTRFDALDFAARRAIAEAAVPPATTMIGVLSMQASINTWPELKEILDSGPRILDLGTGVGNTVLLLLQLYSTATALGVDSDIGLLSIAANRAEQLGVENRITFHHGPAESLPEAIGRHADLIIWHQQFFARSSRSSTLDMVRRKLKPGGALWMPLAEISIQPGLPPQLAATQRLVYSSWDVPASVAEVEFELAQSGFLYSRVHQGAIFGSILARDSGSI